MRALHLRQTRRVFIALFLTVFVAACDGSDPAGEGPASAENGDGVTISGNQIRIDLTSERGSVLKEEGGFVYVSERQTIAINADGAIRAFASTCTGDGCPVNRFVDEHLLCSCDGSTFNASGLPMQGPARTPLSRYAVSRSGDVVTIAVASSSPDPDPDPAPEPPPYYY